MEYLYKDAEEREQGPVGLRRVIELIDDGVITTATPLRKTSVSYWSPAGAHRAFRELLDPMYAPPEKKLPKMLRPDGTHYETSGARKISDMMNTAESEPARRARLNWIVFRKRIRAGITDIVVHLVALAIIAAVTLQWNWDAGQVWQWNGGNSYSQAKNEKPPGDIYTLWSGGVSFYSRQYSNTSGNAANQYWLDVADPEHKMHILFEVMPLARTAMKFFAGYLVLYALIGLVLRRQTPGMETTNLYLLDNSGHRASPPRALLFAVFWLLIGILFPITALFTNGQGLHAFISGTQVK